MKNVQKEGKNHELTHDEAYFSDPTETTILFGMLKQCLGHRFNGNAYRYEMNHPFALSLRYNLAISFSII